MLILPWRVEWNVFFSPSPFFLWDLETHVFCWGWYWHLAHTHTHSMHTHNTVDGRNPAPPGMYKNLYINYQPQLVSSLAGFLPSGVLQRFSHFHASTCDCHVTWGEDVQIRVTWQERSSFCQIAVFFSSLIQREINDLFMDVCRCLTSLALKKSEEHLKKYIAS